MIKCHWNKLFWKVHYVEKLLWLSATTTHSRDEEAYSNKAATDILGIQCVIPTSNHRIVFVRQKAKSRSVCTDFFFSPLVLSQQRLELSWRQFTLSNQLYTKTSDPKIIQRKGVFLFYVVAYRELLLKLLRFFPSFPRVLQLICNCISKTSFCLPYFRFCFVKLWELLTYVHNISSLYSVIYILQQ